MSQQWREIGGGIEVLSNIDAVDELPDIATIDEEGVWYIESGELAPDYVGPTNWDSGEGQFTDWFSLFDGQILSAIPDSVDYQYLASDLDLNDDDEVTSWDAAIGDLTLTGSGATFKVGTFDGEHDCIKFDADSSDDLGESFSSAVSQPYTVGLAVESTGSLGRIFDSNNMGGRCIVGNQDEEGDPNSQRLWAGNGTGYPAPQNTIQMITAEVNGSDSELWDNGTSLGTDDAGTNDLGGLLLGSGADLADYRIVEMVVSEDAAGVEIDSHLTDKWA